MEKNAEPEQCQPTGMVTPVLSEQCQPTMTTYDKYHSHEWECSDDETYVKPRVLSPESQAKLDSQFIERLKQLSETGENVPDDCKIESIEIIRTDENVLDVHEFETNELTKTDEKVFEDCKNIEIRKCEFVAKIQFLCNIILQIIEIEPKLFPEMYQMVYICITIRN